VGQSMNIFLKAKHWHIFLFIFCIPLLLIIMFMILSNSVTSFFITYRIIPVLSLVSGLLYWCWIWAVFSNLEDKIPEGIELNTDFFKLFFIITIIFCCSYTVYNMIFFGRTAHGFFKPRLDFYFFLLPLYLFMIFCNFYCLHFISKTLKTVQLGRLAKFNDYAGDFMLFMFYPLGVWFLQPLLNNFAANEDL
jgi:hypothetical protein